MKTESQSAKNITDSVEPASEILLPAADEPAEAKDIALKIIAIIGIIFALRWAQNFIVTALFGILLAYTLNPVVKWMELVKIPRFIGSSIVILSLIVTIVFAGYTLSGQIESIIAKLPEVASKLNTKLISKGNQSLTKMQTAANVVEKATNVVDNTVVPPKKNTMHIVVDEPKFKINAFLWRGSQGIFSFVGESIMMIIMAYFSLLSGDSFKRKLVRLTGPTLTRKKITVNILDEITNSIQRYLFMLLTTGFNV